MSPKSFEQKLERLEEIVTAINTGELPLDEAMKLFEEGVGLIRELNENLTEARGRITQFMESLGQEVPLDVPEDA